MQILMNQRISNEFTDGDRRVRSFPTAQRALDDFPHWRLQFNQFDDVFESRGIPARDDVIPDRRGLVRSLVCDDASRLPPDVLEARGSARRESAPSG